MPHSLHPSARASCKKLVKKAEKNTFNVPDKIKHGFLQIDGYVLGILKVVPGWSQIGHPNHFQPSHDLISDTCNQFMQSITICKELHFDVNKHKWFKVLLKGDRLKVEGHKFIYQKKGTHIDKSDPFNRWASLTLLGEFEGGELRLQEIRDEARFGREPPTSVHKVANGVDCQTRPRAIAFLLSPSPHPIPDAAPGPVKDIKEEDEEVVLASCDDAMEVEWTLSRPSDQGPEHCAAVNMIRVAQSLDSPTLVGFLSLGIVLSLLLVIVTSYNKLRYSTILPPILAPFLWSRSLLVSKSATGFYNHGFQAIADTLSRVMHVQFELEEIFYILDFECITPQIGLPVIHEQFSSRYPGIFRASQQYENKVQDSAKMSRVTETVKLSSFAISLHVAFVAHQDQ
ncbi:hypothetical protein R3P38DRAFT_2769011 [Favolaschia claudopus]|uniref:Uncharacterized protein n=1 Tax=Favolaschia claudopus TaxID=2862362 RepID=A0AAW0CLQ4_9AGAR